MSDRKIMLYDSFEGKKREFVPLEKNKVDIYYCGPTVYNYVHLGNMRPATTFDLLARVFKEEGYDCRLVSNYTDIDDKIIKQSKIENKSESDLANFYIQAYEDCLSNLNILPLYYHPRAVDYIQKMATFIKELMDSNHAYQAGNDIYFRVNSVDGYGLLSKQKIDDLVFGARIDVNSAKESPLDFALWKLTDDDGIKFDTPIGRGRPGWHTECVVMVNSVFNKPLIDIHGGGFDLKFPHHENEMAQSMAHNNTRLANYWMHCGFLLIDNVKMSKSLGNSILAKDVISRHSGNAVRLFFLTTHYRAPVNYSEEVMNQCDKQVEKYYNSLRKATYKLQLNNIEEGSLLEDYYNDFMNSLVDDLNVANAMTVIDKLTKEMNTLSMQKTIDFKRLASLVYTYNKLIDILGLKFVIEKLNEEDIDMYNRYQKAREEKDYKTSDELRGPLASKGLL